jgi:hypothetical protein
VGYIYTELYDIEHETVGIYTYERRTKDLGGVVPSDVHAETVLIVDLIPEAPGRDLALPEDGRSVVVPVRVSHHGRDPLLGTLHWTLGDASGSAPVDAKPFVVTDPIDVVPRPARGRLLLWATDASGVLVARTTVDLTNCPL